MVAGTVFALLLIPASGYYQEGALLPAGLALSAGLLLAPIVSGLRSPQSLFRTEHLLMAGLIYWIMLDAIQSNFRLWDVSHESVQTAFLCTGVFAASLWAGSSGASFSFPGRTVAAPSGADFRAGYLLLAGVLCFLLGIAEPVATCQLGLQCVVDTFFTPRFATPWHAGPGIRGWNTVLHHLRFFGYLVLPITAAMLHLDRRVNWRSLLLGLLSVVFLLFLLREGGRRSVGTVIGAAILVWILLDHRPRLRHYLMLLIGGIGMLVLLQAMLVWRNVGFGTALTLGQEISDEDAPLIVVDRNLEWMANVIQVVPERHPHTGLSGVIYVLAYPVPRSVLPGKPVARGIDLPKYMGRSYGPGYSWTCSAIGDLYLMGGIWVVALGGLFYGVLANASSRLLFRPVSVRGRLVYSLAAMTLFVSLRALHEVMATGFIVFAVWCLILVWDAITRPIRRADGWTVFRSGTS